MARASRSAIVSAGDLGGRVEDAGESGDEEEVEGSDGLGLVDGDGDDEVIGWSCSCFPTYITRQIKDRDQHRLQ